jgi:hypothetical protein
MVERSMKIIELNLLPLDERFLVPWVYNLKVFLLHSFFNNFRATDRVFLPEVDNFKLIFSWSLVDLLQYF